MRKILQNILLISLLIGFGYAAKAEAQPDPRGAFLRSLAVPGWGHHYVDNQNWTRGQYHLAGDIILIASYFGLDARAGNLQGQYITLAQLKAGVDISSRDRTFRLAIGNFSNLDEYNDFQLRRRTWNMLIDDTPDNQWQWASADDRARYRDLREDVDRTRQQLPALISLMVVNRVISGISAYNRARSAAEIPELSFSPVFGDNQNTGVVANLRFTF